MPDSSSSESLAISAEHISLDLTAEDEVHTIEIEVADVTMSGHDEAVALWRVATWL